MRPIDADKLLDDITAAKECGGMGAIVAGTLMRYVMRQPTLTQQNEPRMINADKLAKRIAGHSNYHGDSILAAIYCAAEGKESNTTIRPIETPPNEPLTIEQLREMDGEWVTIKAFDREISGTMPAIIKDEFATTLCELGARAVVPDLCEVHFPFIEYRKTWSAYRHPTERQEDT